MEKSGRKLSFKARNPDETKEKILEAATAEFAAYGFLGARVERIAQRSEVTMRMLYHYYKGKEYLYGVVLAHVIDQIETAEKAFRPASHDPREKMAETTAFAFDLFLRNPTYVKLAMGQNFLDAEHLRRVRTLGPRHEGLAARVREALEEGQAAGLFRGGVDPHDLWITVYSLVWTQAAGLVPDDRSGADILAARRAQVRDVVLAYLRA